MRASVTAPFVVALGFIHPVIMSFSTLPGDVEGSGQDLQDSGSGDWSEQDEITTIKMHPNNKDQTTDIKHWPTIDFESQFVVGNHKSFLENQQIITVIIAGGVTGVILAALLSALFIFKWQMKDDGGHILGRKVYSEEVCTIF